MAAFSAACVQAKSGFQQIHRPGRSTYRQGQVQPFSASQRFWKHGTAQCNCLLLALVAFLPRRVRRQSRTCQRASAAALEAQAGQVARRHSAAAFALLVPGAARAGLFGEDTGRNLLDSGMRTFVAAGSSDKSKDKVQESVQLFDKAAESGYPANRLWQRGLSLYYADRFEEGAKQFRDDVALNPDDTEESIWAMLCEAQTVGFDQARKQMLNMDGERRPYMRAVYKLFRGEEEAKSTATLAKMAAGTGVNEFYASLYLGLFAEAKGDKEGARRWLSQAAVADHGKNSGDYMGDLARVHMAVRGWKGS